MNIRQAILRAADHIEKHPGEFAYSSCEVPSAPNCGTPGCAVGWIMTFMGIRDDSMRFFQFARAHMGIDSEACFYERMNPLGGAYVGEWMDSAGVCARALRIYADKYHPESRALIPANVRAIFEMTTAQLAREFERA